MMNSPSSTLSHCRKRTATPPSSPLLLLRSFLHPSIPDTLLSMKAASETWLGSPEQVWSWTQMEGTHILQEAHGLKIHIESYSLSITVFPRVTYTSLTAKTILSLSKTHTTEQSDQQSGYFTLGVASCIAHKNKLRCQWLSSSTAEGLSKLCPIYQP